MFRSLLAAFALTVLATPVLAQNLALVGPDGQAVALNAAELAALPRQTVAFATHGESHVYEGPLLIDVLAKAGAPTGKALHGPEMADVVLVEASDGYTVALGLAEADPGTRANRIILADRADGAALAAKDAPFRLVVEGDLRPARSARGVTRITVIRHRGGAAVSSHAH
ncbi:molybdopterin-dependent oxidoreductase [Caulobacter sp. 602-1]|uniref:molybdopterin-dependent oxidoreductase n=1 Tax=Caulobacter sp. 602-1 TaxID=2492472 RepID=UPI000F6346BA|nr:molybdopterin-dependent oxidoreductase [Caulobacter sp. 602-1]RRN65807.1 molybdopterin-binding oxidoreductase [Caulobacter sp. 602-1]